MNSENNNTEVVSLAELGKGIVQITMKDEEHNNTFSPGLVKGLYKCFDTVAQNLTYKVVILTGYGNYFASGAGREHLIAIHKKEIQFNNSEVLSLLLNCKIPVISAMQGHGIGGGLVLGLYADLIVFSKESIYSISSMKYGFTPVGGSSLVVTEKLGSGLGQEMMYTAQNYRGEELAKRGISFPVVPQKDVLNHAQRLANQIVEKPRLSLITFKEYLTSKIREKLPQCTKKEAEMFEITFHQPEVIRRIESVYGESKVTVNKPHYESQAQVDKPANTQNPASLSPEELQPLKSRNLSVDNAESMPLDIDKNNQEFNEQDYILSDLQTGKISVDDAADLFVKSYQQEIKSQDNSKTFPSKQIKNRFTSYLPSHSTRFRLFCFHGVGGSGSWFKNWSKSFQSDIEVYPVDLPGRAINSKEKPFTDFLPLIKTLGKIIGHEIDSPFAFYGHSMGALIGLKLAYLLQHDYDLSPVHFFVSGCWSPHHTQDLCSRNLSQFADLDQNNLDNLDLNYLGETLDIPVSVIKEGSLLQRSIPIFHADLKLLQSYSQTPNKSLNCPISAFGGLEDPIVSQAEILEWRHHTNSTFKSQMLPGKHLFIRNSHNKKLILDAIAQDLTISLNQRN